MDGGSWRRISAKAPRRRIASRAVDLRAQGDKQLAEALLAEPAVREAAEELKKLDRRQRRRALLGSAVRLVSALAPRMVESVAVCRERLAIEQSVEVYVLRDPQLNAFCYGEERGRVLVVLTSALIEAMDEDELRFVIGHELGHHMCGHFEIPVALLLDGRMGGDARNTLRLFAWQRYAEVSADRAGLLCAGSFPPVANAFFKIASGLSSKHINFDVDAYLAQIGDIQQEALEGGRSEREAQADWFASHPFSPLRIRVAQLTAESTLLREGGTPRERLEQQTEELISLMDPGYLNDRSEAAEAMRRLLFAAGVVIVSGSAPALRGGVAGESTDAAEVAAFEALLGPGALPSRPRIDEVEAQLPERVAQVRQLASPLKRGNLVRDLTVIAAADGKLDEREQELLEALCEQLEIDPTLVERTLETIAHGLD
jgi:Zn-dependent protease with chaperone function